MSSLSIQIGHGDNPVASNPSGDIEVVTTTTSIKEDNFALEDNQDDLVSVEDEDSVSVDNTWAETTTKGEKKNPFSLNKCLFTLGFLALFGTALMAGTAVGSSKAFKSMNAAAATGCEEVKLRDSSSGSTKSGKGGGAKSGKVVARDLYGKSGELRRDLEWSPPDSGKSGKGCSESAKAAKAADLPT